MENLDSILLIDDDPICNFLHSRLLKKLHISNEVKVSLNGKDALLHLHEVSQINLCPQLIFLDINMPVMNGIEFLQSYKAETFCNKRPVIIVLTTSTDLKDIVQLQNYPEVNGVLNKPLTEEKINSIIAMHFAA